MGKKSINSDLLSSLPTYKEKMLAFCYGWNPEDCSANIYIKPDGFTLHRRWSINNQLQAYFSVLQLFANYLIWLQLGLVLFDHEDD